MNVALTSRQRTQAQYQSHYLVDEWVKGFHYFLQEVDLRRVR